MNKIEIIVPRITNLYPEINDIKKFSSQYSNSEWNRLCTDKQFCNFILEDLQNATKRAETILGKKIEIKETKNFSNPS